MPAARANGRLKGKAPKLSARQRVHVLSLAQAGEHTIAELAELFSVSRATIYRELAPIPPRPDLAAARPVHTRRPRLGLPWTRRRHRLGCAPHRALGIDLRTRSCPPTGPARRAMRGHFRSAKDACRCTNAGGAVGPEWFARTVPRPQPGGPGGRLAHPRLRMHGGPRRGSRQLVLLVPSTWLPLAQAKRARRSWRRPWPPNGRACGLRPRCADHDSKAATAPAPGLPGRSWPTTSTRRHPNRLTASPGSGPPARPPPETPNGRALHPRRGRSHSTPIM